MKTSFSKLITLAAASLLPLWLSAQTVREEIEANPALEEDARDAVRKLRKATNLSTSAITAATEPGFQVPTRNS